MAKQTDYSLCRDCKSRKVEYRVSTTGTPLKHGYCRDCYERNAAKSVKGCGRFCTPRDPEKMENVRETKFGIDR